MNKVRISMFRSCSVTFICVLEYKFQWEVFFSKSPSPHRDHFSTTVKHHTPRALFQKNMTRELRKNRMPNGQSRQRHRPAKTVQQRIIDDNIQAVEEAFTKLEELQLKIHHTDKYPESQSHIMLTIGSNLTSSEYFMIVDHVSDALILLQNRQVFSEKTPELYCVPRLKSAKSFLTSNNVELEWPFDAFDVENLIQSNTGDTSDAR